MVNKAELKRKYDLVANEVYPELRKEYLDYIVKQANTSLPEGILRGMLLLINESDKWETNFISARKKEEE